MKQKKIKEKKIITLGVRLERVGVKDRSYPKGLALDTACCAQARHGVLRRKHLVSTLLSTF